MRPETNEQKERRLARGKAYYLRNKAAYKSWGKAYRQKPEVKERIRQRRAKDGPARERMLEAKRKWGASQPKGNRDAYFNSPERKALKSEYDRKRRSEKAALLAGQQKAWRDQNQDHMNAYCRNKRAASPQYAISNNMRCRVNTALRHQGLKRDAPLEVLLGCTIPELMAHLEKQWLPGMSWQNRGHHGVVWHVDHIKPCSSFDLTDPKHRAECFHFTNLQPLWAVENIRKGGPRRKVQRVA